jgi:hypothetical protein
MARSAWERILATDGTGHPFPIRTLADCITAVGSCAGTDDLVVEIRAFARGMVERVLGSIEDPAYRKTYSRCPKSSTCSAKATEQASEIWRELRDPAFELRALNEPGLLKSTAGRLSEADLRYEAVLDLARRVGDTSGEWLLLQNQAVLAHLDARAGRGDYARVPDLHRSSLDRRRRRGPPHILVLANLAQAEVEAGHLHDGRRHAEEALRLG